MRQSDAAAGEVSRRESMDVGLRHRGKHDEMLRPFCAGHQFRFDIVMDVGGFRDMHRHRRCIQIGQEFTAAHGYDTPAEVISAGLEPRYQQTMHRAAEAAAALTKSHGATTAVYVLPMAYRKRTLFNMDF